MSSTDTFPGPRYTTLRLRVGLTFDMSKEEMRMTLEQVVSGQTKEDGQCERGNTETESGSTVNRL